MVMRKNLMKTRVNSKKIMPKIKEEVPLVLQVLVHNIIKLVLDRFKNQTKKIGNRMIVTLETAMIMQLMN